MTALLFDTHAAIKDLIGAGLAEKEAEAIVKVMNSSQGDLATKTDLKELGQELRQESTETEHRITLRVGVMLAVAVAALVASTQVLITLNGLGS